MDMDILDEAQRLRAERRPFSLATVVAARQPTSGTPGAHAIILAGGEIEGWIGGQCAQPAVVREGLAALADGTPRLIVLRPNSQALAIADRAPTPGVIEVPMLCASEGELSVFVQPFLPQVELVVIGASPVARKLAALASQLDFAVWACDADADMDSFPAAQRLVAGLDALRPQLGGQNYVVVATTNAYDEEAARVALESDASYVGLIASQKRLATIQETLRGQGVAEERIGALRRPKGLPGTTLLPSEIAFSALADLMEARRQRVGFGLDATPAAKPERAEAIDPICGMTVDIATARHTSQRDGETYYFCCAGCKAQFEAQVVV